MCGSVNAVEGNSPRGHVEGQSMQHKGDLQGRKVIRFCDYVDPRTFVGLSMGPAIMSCIAPAIAIGLAGAAIAMGLGVLLAASERYSYAVYRQDSQDYLARTYTPEGVRRPMPIPAHNEVAG